MGIADDITWSVGNELTYNYYFVRPHYPWIFISNSWSRWCSRPSMDYAPRVQRGTRYHRFRHRFIESDTLYKRMVIFGKKFDIKPSASRPTPFNEWFSVSTSTGGYAEENKNSKFDTKGFEQLECNFKLPTKNFITPLLFRPQLVSSLSFRWLFTFHFRHFRRFSLIWGWVPFHSCSDDTKFSETQFRHGAVEKRISPATICIDNEAIFKSLI